VLNTLLSMQLGVNWCHHIGGGGDEALSRIFILLAGAASLIPALHGIEVLLVPGGEQLVEDLVVAGAPG
jgi:hypothetical protein